MIFENEMKKYANEKIPGQHAYNMGGVLCLGLCKNITLKFEATIFFETTPEHAPHGCVLFTSTAHFSYVEKDKFGDELISRATYSLGCCE